MGFTGPNHALQLLGVTLIGVTPENGRKLLLTFTIFLLAWLAARAIDAVIGAVTQADRWPRLKFWIRQAAKIVITISVLIVTLSIWFDDPTRLATAFGLLAAGLAFALQRVITAVAGYVVILRGRTFNVGDRIVMGGVRGDVIALGFMQTTIMEMGQPPPVQKDDPAMWVKARQYTGRIVTVTNAKVFDEPVYNYTNEFRYLFEEIVVPVKFDADRALVEKLMLDVTRNHTRQYVDIAAEDAGELQRRYFMSQPDLEPRVFISITDNWLELTVRFVATAHGLRELKDAISRDLLAAFDAAGVSVASSTFEVVGLPPVQLQLPDEATFRSSGRLP